MELIVDNSAGPEANILEFRQALPARCKAQCVHQRFTIDRHHGSVHCVDCGDAVSAFHALTLVAQHDSALHQSWKARRKEMEEIKAYQPWLRAVKALEKIWRGRMLPMCPHCGRGVRAEALGERGCVSPEYDAALAAKDPRP